MRSSDIAPLQEIYPDANAFCEGISSDQSVSLYGGSSLCCSAIQR